MSSEQAQIKCIKRTKKGIPNCISYLYNNKTNTVYFCDGTEDDDDFDDDTDVEYGYLPQGTEGLLQTTPIMILSRYTTSNSFTFKAPYGAHEVISYVRDSLGMVSGTVNYIAVEKASPTQVKASMTKTLVALESVTESLDVGSLAVTTIAYSSVLPNMERK
eukprot:UN30715